MGLIAPIHLITCTAAAVRCSLQIGRRLGGIVCALCTVKVLLIAASFIVGVAAAIIAATALSALPAWRVLSGI